MIQFHLKATQLYLEAKQQSERRVSTINFIEAAPSMLREMPWIQHKDLKVSFMCLLNMFSTY